MLFADGSTLAMAVPAIARTIALTGPAFTLILEAVVPALHVFDPRSWPALSLLGVAATLVFHMVIALTPPPSNVSTYGVTTCTRLFFMLPDAVAAALAELTALKRNGAILAATMAACRRSRRWWRRCMRPLPAPSKAWAPTGTADTTWLSSCSSRVRRIWSGEASISHHQSTPCARPQCRRGRSPSHSSTFLLPVLGLQEKSGVLCSRSYASMVANHLVLPTSLLSACSSTRVPTTPLPAASWWKRPISSGLGTPSPSAHTRLVREVAKACAVSWAARRHLSREAYRHRASAPHAENLGSHCYRRIKQRDTFGSASRASRVRRDEAWRTSSGGVEYVVHGKDGEIRCARRGALLPNSHVMNARRDC